jgi:hypothetical protein
LGLCPVSCVLCGMAGRHGSAIRRAIAPAFGVRDTGKILSVMSKHAFVTTVDIAVKLVTLAQVRGLA